MLYLHHHLAGEPSIYLEGDMHRYIFKVRRHKVGDKISLRTLKDRLLHHYTIASINKKTLMLVLEESEDKEVKASRFLHIAWCIIDPKSIEKVLPSLNEIGVEKISFIYCKRSQKSFKIDKMRLEKILLNSSQQSGRSQMMTLEVLESLESFLEKYPKSKMLNFSKNTLNAHADISTIVIGCEGGFHEEEVALFEASNILGFDSPLVLKSESAVCAVASKILL
ncbi:Ribosomal RNA small subunit methyltransferase E [hydrothermal vent metagenome]|uniref:16S rRNA (uracil(1498)-N(3))-methyltransferase n=1 Tax=hydrothermal vent metagenome TaxID=652676 RepID=A0A1W1D1B1_9ZZZZ